MDPQKNYCYVWYAGRHSKPGYISLWAHDFMWRNWYNEKRKPAPSQCSWLIPGTWEE